LARSYTYNGANQRTQVEKALGARNELRGPSPCPIEKIEDEYHWQIW
jgi:primosomal protein N'